MPLARAAALACDEEKSYRMAVGPRERVTRRLAESRRRGPMLALFFEVNARLLAGTLVALGVHQATAVWDVSYAEGKREVSQTEQHVHGCSSRCP